MSYESRKLVNDDGPSRGGRNEHPTWRKIREWSVLEFVNRLAKYLGASEDKGLREALFDMALSDGSVPFKCQGIVWSGPMVLDAWA
jgi:hypothetical protein